VTNAQLSAVAADHFCSCKFAQERFADQRRAVVADDPFFHHRAGTPACRL